MQFEENKSLEKIGVILGFTFSYLLFTTGLFVIFVSLKNIEGLAYMHFIGITLLITITGTILKRVL